MSDKIAKKETTQALQTRTPALNGDELDRTIALSEDLVRKALHECHTSFAIFDSEETKMVRRAQHDIVMQRLRTKQDALRYLDEAGMTILRTALDQVVIYGCEESMAETSTQLFARRASLEAELGLIWRRFCENAVEEMRWAKSMPTSVRRHTAKKNEASLAGAYSMMETMLRNFGSLAHQRVGKP